MAEKLLRLQIKRDPRFLYFVRAGDVWRVRRRGDPSAAGDKASRVAPGPPSKSSKFIYFLDGDGDLARVRRRGENDATTCADR